jgi:F0F1-type ATP synthase membrane subunit b/b'
MGKEVTDMAKVSESPEPAVSETEGIIQEYWDKIKQALEVETGKLKERAERESNQIMARAKEDADKALAEARQEARAESQRIIAEAREEAGVIVRESREEAQEARRESAGIISETREKASQIVTEVIERGTAEAQNEFARAAAEAKNKTSRLLAQVSKGVDQIIGETETTIKAELERLADLIAEVETKLKPIGETDDEEVEAKSRRETQEEARPVPSISERKEPAASPVAEKRGGAIRESDDARLFKGRLKLEVVPPHDGKILEGFPERLAKISGLKIVSKGGYSGVNRWSAYTIDLDQPTSLLKTLKAISIVEDVAERNGNVVIKLK